LGEATPSAAEAGFVITHNRFGIPGHDVWEPIRKGLGAVDAPVEADVIETLRLEHGIPRWGAELTTATLPPEAGPHMLEAISYTKGCYVGQETIARLKSVGHVNRSLVFLKSDSAAFPINGAKLTRADHEVGVVTSSGYSPRLERGIALGYAQRAATENGTSLQANGLNLTVAAPL
jgi:aminomethyltransferase